MRQWRQGKLHFRDETTTTVHLLDLTGDEDPDGIPQDAPCKTWVCSRCTFKNAALAKVCVVCDGPRLLQTDDGSTAPWECQACTFLNVDSSTIKCAICASDRFASAENRASKRRRHDHNIMVAASSTSSTLPTTRVTQLPSSTESAKNAFHLLQQPLPPLPARAPPDNNAIPRCDVGDTIAVQSALRDVGVVILRHVVSGEQIASAEHLFFDWLESLPLGVRRDDARTIRSTVWRQLGYNNTGVIANYSIGQSEFMWYLRTLPNVRRAFATVWNLIPSGSCGDNEIPPLITSFDGCGAQRNIFLEESEPDWLTQGRWFHLDQNYRIHSKLHAYQGVLNMYPSDALSGSTVVVPGSHHHFRDICAAHPEARGNFVKLAESRQPGRGLVGAAVQAILEPGDLLVWDSRIVHCNQGPCPQRCRSQSDTVALMGERSGALLSRLVAYIAMLPASRLSPSLAAARRECVQDGRSTGHDASYVPRQGKRIHKHPSYKQPDSSAPLWQLVDPGMII